MLEPDGMALGIAAARRLAELGRTVIRPGLTDREFDEVEQRFGFQFADDHRAFLAEGLPVWTEGDDDPDNTIDLGWPNWRDGDPGQLRTHLDFALEGALASVKNGYWHPWWGDDRPSDAAEALRVARERLVADGPGGAAVGASVLACWPGQVGAPGAVDLGRRCHLLRRRPAPLH